jgi:protein phosphatase
VYSFDHFVLAILANGVTTHPANGRAARVAIRSLHETLTDAQPDDAQLSDALVAAVQEANHAVFTEAQQDARLSGMSASIILAAMSDKEVHIMHVGDARAYRLNSDGAKALTREHTIVNVYIDAELLAEEDAASHPEAHVLARSIGTADTVEVEVAPPLKLSKGDRIVMCTRGVHASLSTTSLGKMDGKNPDSILSDVLASCADKASDVGQAALVLHHDAGSQPASLLPELPSLPEHGWETGDDAAQTEEIDPAAIFLAEALAMEEEEATADSIMVYPTPHEVAVTTPSPESEEDVADVTQFVKAESTPSVQEDVLPEEDDATEAATPLPQQRTLRPTAQQRAGIQEPLTRTNPVKKASVMLAVSVIGSALALGYFASPAPLDETAVEEAQVTLSEVNGKAPVMKPVLDASTLGAANELLAQSNAEAHLLFAPNIPEDPRRLPRRPRRYTQPPPGGEIQWKAVQSARSRNCGQALDVVRAGMGVSVDHAQLYEQAWYCFNNTHQRPLAQAEAAYWEDFSFLVHHFEGTPEEREARLTPKDMRRPSWHRRAVGGVEYRLEKWNGSLPEDLLADVLNDIVGESVVADHLVKDVLMEAEAAVGLSRVESPNLLVINWWARRVYVTAWAMHGRIGRLIEQHRPEMVPVINALLEEATRAQPERLPAMRASAAMDDDPNAETLLEQHLELWDETGLPKSVALAQATALGLAMPELEPEVPVKPAKPAKRSASRPKTPKVEEDAKVKIYRLPLMIQSEE